MYKKRLHKYRKNRLRRFQHNLGREGICPNRRARLRGDDNIQEITTPQYNHPEKQTETQHDIQIPTVYKEKCIGCGTCEETCPGKAIHLEDGIAVINEDNCRRCRKCIKVCPVNAIK